VTHACEPPPRDVTLGAEAFEPDVGALAAAVRQGDPVAFGRLYDAYFPRLYGYLLVAARGREELVRDALQETFFRVVRYVRPLPDEGAMWRWLVRVARTALIDLVRRDRGGPRALVREIAAPEAHPDAHEREVLAALDRTVALLPDSERELVEAYYLRGESQAALAARLDVTRKSVESRLARIRRKLRTLILEDLGDGR
jgi:RNA polymerase sigma-70 factor (ECF subfamily)